MKHCRRVLILIFIMAAVFALMSPSSFAMGPNSFKAWILSALTAANIVVDSTLPITAPIDDFIVNPFNITDNIIESVDYALPYVNIDYKSPRETLAEYMEREGTIKVRGDTVTIDGIDYTDIWVDNDAAQALRTNVFDLQTAWDIASNSSGTFVSGVGTFDGLPVFNSNGIYQSQNYTNPLNTSASQGGWTFSSESLPTTIMCYLSDSSGKSATGTTPDHIPSFSVRRLGNGYYRANYGYWSGNYSSVGAHLDYSPSHFDAEPFDFTWVSQDVPAEVLPQEDGLHILVPNNPQQFSDPVVQQHITNFNNNMTFSPDVSINMSDPGIMDALDLLMDTINTLINLTKPSYGPYDQSPVPPVPPVDPDSIANTPWVQLQQRIDNIINHLTSQGTILGNISSQLGDIINSIGDITGKIVNGDRQWYKDITDSIKKPFLPILTTFKNVTGIWHYVVSWVGVISAPFTWSLSALGSAGSIFLAPLYAAFAAAIVIAIYRRFGK